MKVFPRSFWTAIPPRPTTVGDQFAGLPYFNTAPTGTTFHPVGKDLLYVYRNPATELNLLLKEATNHTGLSDIDYNYAISQNTEGVYVLRGKVTKCQKTDKIKVLVLLGEDERPTDTLKKNQEDFLNSKILNPHPSPILRGGDYNVHVFDLIEYLAEKGYYRSRNDGMFGPLVEHAIREMQLELDIPNLTGEYNDWIYNKLQEADREYIETK